MENPGMGAGAPKRLAGRLDIAESIAPDRHLQVAARALAAGLIALPDACETAAILRRRLDLRERIWLAASGVLALPADRAEALACAVLAEIAHHRLAPQAREAGRQTAIWRAYVGRSTYRSPALTPAERRRAAAISFDESPRAELAAAWQAATERDRRDLIRRATERVI
jgi:hypothetical protein